MKTTQKERIINKLKRDGYITRNECLRVVPAITRLAEYARQLKEEGWEFETKDNGKDYMYKVTKCPLKTITYTLEDGRTITNYA